MRAGMRLGRRCRAARPSRWSRPTPFAPRRSGSARCAGWRGSARRSSRPARARRSSPSSRSAGLYGSIAAVLARARRALGPPARLGAGPNRLCAHAAATRMRARRPAVIVPERGRAAAARRVAGGGAARPAAATSGGEAGRRRHSSTPWSGWACGRWASSRHSPPKRSPTASASRGCERCAWRAASTSRFGPGARTRSSVERLGLPEAASGQQLERALGLLIERLLAHPARAGRTIRRLRLEARLAGGRRLALGGRAAQRARASPERLRLALTPRLGELPGPATSLALRALELGPEAGDQAQLRRSPSEERRGRLGEAVRQARAAAGRDAILQVIEVDPRSRVPERRAILTPFRRRRGWLGHRSIGRGRCGSTPARTACP